MTQPIRPQNYRQEVFLRKLRTRLNGNHTALYGLSKIKGIGRRFSQAVLRVMNLDPQTRIGVIPEKDLKKIEEIILNPVESGIPYYLVNRRKDLKDGEDKHIIGNRLEITVKRDIERMKKMRSYKGIRHELGLKVRGQRTKSTGRGGLVIGVVRSKLREKAKKERKKEKKEKE
ncbi:MAG: 30S ribosomal protein S13 [Promethearchaeia archaeon]